jgi:hypothetical protein
MPNQIHDSHGDQVLNESQRAPVRSHSDITVTTHLLTSRRDIRV